MVVWKIQNGQMGGEFKVQAEDIKAWLKGMEPGGEGRKGQQRGSRGGGEHLALFVRLIQHV